MTLIYKPILSAGSPQLLLRTRSDNVNGTMMTFNCVKLGRTCSCK